MHEAQSWQAKGIILPHHYTQIITWLRGINWPNLCFWFTMCKGLFSWENMGKIDDLWNCDAWSQILTCKRHDTTTPLFSNQHLTQIHQLAIPMFLIHLEQGSFFLGKHRKIGNLWNLGVCEAQSWQAKGMILPHHYMKFQPWITCINWEYPCFWFPMCKGLLSWENAEKMGNLWNFDAWSQILIGKNTILPQQFI